MRLVAALALAVLLAGAAPGSADQGPPGIDLRHPPDLTVVARPDLPVEGRVTNPAIEEVAISVNGGREETARVRDSFFSLEVELEEGENVVTVAGKAIAVWYDDGEHPAPGRYRRVYGHAGLDDGCGACHELDRDGALVLAGDRSEVCGWCHGDLVRGKRGAAWASVHRPVEEGACLTCHTPHLGGRPGLLVEKVPACADCHAAVVARLGTDRFVHGPMHLGDCRLCHAVHSSAQPALLARPATALCTDCHSDVIPPAGAPAQLRPHTMIPEGRCGACHEPHSSANPRMLRQAATRLCLDCHEGKTRSFHEAKGFSIYVCAKCHDLHRPSQEHLLADASRSLCLQCHDFGGPAAFTHSFVRDGECFRCHAFHEAPLGRDVALTCLGCHRENPRLPAAHGGLPFQRSRCTACHLPHQSRKGKLLRDLEHEPFSERDCGACHGERAALFQEAWRPLCVDCHHDQDLAARPRPPASVHPPVRDGDCADCHESHDAQFPALLRTSLLQLCLECHRALRKSFLIAPDSAHDSFLEGRCGVCHDPHAADEVALLRAPPGRLCGGCHAALVAGGDGGPWAHPHEPVAAGKCRLCHRPHVSGNAKLLKSPSPQPCRPCHAGFFKEIEAAPEAGRHRPVREGRCEACHGVHGGEHASLLRAAAADVCAPCHPSPQSGHHMFRPAELAAKPGGARAGERGCLHCHLPHASAERKLLPAASSPVCAGCHPR